MNALVIGYGSIGSRHARILAELGCRTAVVSSRPVHVETLFADIEEAFQSMRPGYVVVASETSRHAEDLAGLASCAFKGTLLVEKPLFHELPENLPRVSASTYVAYNLRFHRLVARLRELLKHESILTVQAYAGQYLPLWRPERDYRNVYSASQKAGGGVLRDLSHELDLLNWLLGGWQKMTALGGHYSSLEITSDDTFAILMSTNRCPVVSLQLNYLDRIGKRRILVNTDGHTFEADFTTGQLLIDGQAEEYRVDRDHTYREMHRALLGGDTGTACTFAEGLEVVKMISAAERAVAEGTWITN